MKKWFRDAKVVNSADSLLFRATKDGFTKRKFHRKCDNKGPTVCIIKTEDGDIIGGYTEESWSGDDEFKIDRKAWLFTFKDGGSRFLVSASGENAIRCDKDEFITFGSGADIEIADKCNQNNNSFVNPSSDYLYGGKTLIGDEQDQVEFKVLEIEVYSISKVEEQEEEEATLASFLRVDY